MSGRIIGLRGQPVAIILLTGHINKLFPKSLSLCSEINASLNPHQKLLFAVDGDE